jgi:transposase-like protein
MSTMMKLARRGWRQWTPEEARSALTRWEKSGLPLATFARQLGVSNTRLRWWRERLGEWTSPSESTATKFVPAVVTSVSSSAAPVAVVQVRGGSIEVFDAGATPAQWLIELARGLRES